mmetsp:Transcript_890/g.2502  ORF Transcript_890/g.2502 Transcript_890/m.2502 type:complete len:489 (-) Transcript_890:202-1668(-)
MPKGRETPNERDDGYSRRRGYSSCEESRRRGSASRGGDPDEYNRNGRRSRNNDDDEGFQDRGRDQDRSYGDGDRDRRQIKRPKQKRAWPPPFDTDGALYVFDSRSGFFYEAESNFFFDPKSRYYYSIAKKAYFEYCPEQELPFRQVPPHGEMDTAVASGDEQAGLPTIKLRNEGEGDERKMKIAISLKTKTPLGVSSGGTGSVKPSMDTGAMNLAKHTSPPESRGIKQSQAAYDADIAKWNHARSSNVGSRTSGSPATEAASKSALKTTKTGQPICLLCRRKFANMEALHKHEQSSALHKQNLAKKEKDAAEAPKPTCTRPENSSKPSLEYRDRAKDRRSMYGTDLSRGGAAPLMVSTESSPGTVISSASADFGPNLERARAVAATAAVMPSDALGDSNIGSQMLQKIGWKKGSSLGKKQSLEARASSDGASGRPIGSDANTQMLQEWERIESAAAAAAASSSSSQSARSRGGTSSRAGIGNKGVGGK